jgi:putative DNA primase/helicase
MRSSNIMNSNQFESRVSDMKVRAHGHWTPLLESLGVDAAILNGKNQPCPMCGGTDRFQYTDKFLEGNYHCRSCGAGGGLKLAQCVLGIKFGELLERIEQQLGTVQARTPSGIGSPSPQKMKRLCQRIWNEARPITVGDEVDRYLRDRRLQLSAYPRTLRFHAALGYFEKPVGQQRSKKVADYPAMLAVAQGPDGHAVTLHRTYLKDGRKAVGAQSRKVLSSGINGAAVRLIEPTDELAITEGIETALAVHLGTGKPVWAALSCGNMEKLWVPGSVARVCIYADNDADSGFDGQASAYALAHRLMRDARRPQANGLVRKVQVFVPKQNGADWADVWLARLANMKQAA